MISFWSELPINMYLITNSFYSYGLARVCIVEGHTLSPENVSAFQADALNKLQSTNGGRPLMEPGERRVYLTSKLQTALESAAPLLREIMADFRFVLSAFGLRIAIICILSIYGLRLGAFYKKHCLALMVRKLWTTARVRFLLIKILFRWFRWVG